ncbi:hypothetical protein GCK32_017343, partial [Trichostrongylus colubriformis]
MRENNKNVRRANRELESDRRALERREKELVCCTRETARPTTQAEGETCWNELQIHGIGAQNKYVVKLIMMNDALDSILDEPGDEEEQNAIVNQALDEIGIE